MNQRQKLQQLIFSHLAWAMGSVKPMTELVNLSLTVPLAQFTKLKSRSSSNHQAKFQEFPPIGDLISLIVARLSRNLGKHQVTTVSPRSPVSCFGRIEAVAGIGHAFDVSSLGSCPEEDNIVL
ncbi:hypothetical protein OIU85_002574 [Salix viminalis]|uniref:Uncharacterized protein n=1 Tax=Salix viminalis TaxID=40686 RepID=A0A9Q0VNP5_SALVM|nr:hypothetical protein OIU85_002574 [Salix viminalis]